jgi:hypothetical protein
MESQMQCIGVHEAQMVCVGVRWYALVCNGVRWCALMCKKTEYSHCVHHTIFPDLNSRRSALPAGSSVARIREKKRPAISQGP